MSTLDSPTAVERESGHLLRDLVNPVVEKMVSRRRNMAWTTVAIGIALLVGLTYHFFKTVYDIVGQCDKDAVAEYHRLTAANGPMSPRQLHEFQQQVLTRCVSVLNYNGFSGGDSRPEGVESPRFGNFTPFLKPALTRYHWVLAGMVFYGAATVYAFWASRSIQTVRDDLKKFEAVASSNKKGKWSRTSQSDYYRTTSFKNSSKSLSDPTVFIEFSLKADTGNQRYIRNVTDLYPFTRIGWTQPSDSSSDRNQPTIVPNPVKKVKIKTRGLPKVTDPSKSEIAGNKVPPLEVHVSSFLKDTGPFSEEIRHVVMVNSSFALFISIPRKDWHTAYPDSVQQREAEQAIQKGLTRRSQGQAGLKFIDRKTGFELKTLGAAAGQTRALVGMMSPTMTRVEGSDIRIAHLTLRYSAQANRTLHTG